MAAFSKSTKDALHKSGRFDCCELCGRATPRLENSGLQAAHIVSENDGGIDAVSNAFVLCHACAEAFDRFLKPCIAKAFVECNAAKGLGLKVPDSWKNSEGRRAANDDV